MRKPAIIAAFALLFILLTWSALRSMNDEAESAQAALRHLDAFAATESTLHRDVLRARAGQLRNYDPLVHEVERLYRAIAELSTSMPGDAAFTLEVSRLSDMVEQQERWIEEFKSSNALLQNSLAYFNVFNAQLRDAADSKLILQASAVATALLRLTSDSSRGALSEFEDSIRKLNDKRTLDLLSPRDRDLVQALIAHARLLRDVLPAMDRILRAMSIIPSRFQQDKLRDMVAAREEAAEERAAFYRRIGYGISVILAGIAVTLALRLQSWARTMRRIVRLEHVIADISTRFINVQDDFASAFEHALKELAGCIDADRAYFVRLKEPQHCYKWSRRGIVWPPLWAENAMKYVASLGNADHEIIYHPIVDFYHPTFVPGMPEDVRGWLCVPRRCGERVVGILAFDATRARFKAGRAECRLFRTACDALADAVLREALLGEQRRLEDALEKVRRLDTIGAFASGIAHNFNNIVGAILGYVEMAQSQLETERMPVSHLQEIRRAGERARDLVEQILKFGDQASPSEEEISVTNLLTETWSLLSAAIPQNVSVNIELQEGEIIVRGKPEQLQQVIMNVCINAAQAIEGAGSISIAMRRKSVNAPLQLDHGTITAGECVMISVIDTGRGMDDATRERMFDPFFTTRVDGHGLGLATVREIVLRHGGGIRVDSTPGAGTCLEVWLPCLDVPSVVPGIQAQKNGRKGGETIFLFEANGQRLLRHEEIIAALGFEPVGFIDFGAAIEALQTVPNRFDAAVICHLHGTAAALDVARALSRIAPGTPIILATASAGDLATRILATVGVCEVVGYPLRTGEIACALTRCTSNSSRSQVFAENQSYV